MRSWRNRRDISSYCILKLRIMKHPANLVSQFGTVSHCGYAPEELAAASPRDMDKYYAPEDQKKWGVVGIELSFDF